MQVKIILTFFLTLFFFTGFSQKIRKIMVTLDRPTNGLSVPVSINIDQFSFSDAEKIQLNLVSGKKKKPIAFQISEEGKRLLNWKVPSDAKNEYSRFLEY